MIWENENLANLARFVVEKHLGQKRKYTEEPYVYHVWEVAKIVEAVTDDEILIAVALCHDLLEDTDCTPESLNMKLNGLQFPAGFITGLVVDLTDVYTSEAYPELNRKERKAREARRFQFVHPYAQTVKYADLISNTRSIASRDPEFAKVYIPEKEAILVHATRGNQILYKLAKAEVESAKRYLAHLG